jgi:hypothetical protein
MTTCICPTVWEAGLPSIAYDHLNDPDAAHRAIADARRQGPLAMGPHGPEVLSYELVRVVLRDPRFAPAVRPVMATRASRQARCGTERTRASLDSKARPTTGCADLSRRHSPRAAPSGYGRSSSTS